MELSNNNLKVGEYNLIVRKMIRFYALMTQLYYEAGHTFIYHLRFKSAIQLLGFEYTGYINKKCSIKDLPDDWEKILNWTNGKNCFEKVLQLFKRTLCLKKVFQIAAKKDEKRIFFLESVCILDLVALTFCFLFFSNNTDSLWLLLRDKLSQYSLKEKIYRFILRTIEKEIGKRLILLSDSTRVGHYFETLLNQTLYILPIPHTTEIKAKERISNRTSLWWPGRPDAEKGAKHIQAFVSQLRSSKIDVYLSKSAEPWIQNNLLNLKFLNPVLTRQEYTNQLVASDGILLPYDPHAYYARTSGIFVEAICAGKPSFVLEGSWLAHELKKYDLSELILDWSQPDLLTHIIQLLNDLNVRDKLKQMQTAYLSYHCLDSYTKTVRNILKYSQTDYF